jgi:hypothetical protein
VGVGVATAGDVAPPAEGRLTAREGGKAVRGGVRVEAAGGLAPPVR